MTQSQRMLAHANRKVLARKNADQLNDKYRTAVIKAPGLVKSCGLCQALAFFEAKANKKNDEAGGYRKLLEDITDMPGAGSIKLEDVTKLPTAEYMHRTLRVMDGLGYLKRMVEAYYEEKKDAG